jgi:hypothetical protein
VIHLRKSEQTPKDACLNPKPSSHIYRDLELQKTHQELILAAQTELVGVHLCPQKPTYDLNCINNSKDLEISDLLEDGKFDRSIIKSIDRILLDRNQACPGSIDRVSLDRLFFD